MAEPVLRFVSILYEKSANYIKYRMPWDAVTEMSLSFVIIIENNKQEDLTTWKY